MTQIRLAATHISEATIMGSDSYIVENWTAQNDMTGHYRWYVTHDNTFVRPAARGLDGSGNWYGNWSGILRFGLLTPDMVDYLYDNILAGKPYAPVTAYVYVGGHIGTSPQGWDTIQGYAQFHLIAGGQKYVQPRRGYYGRVDIEIDNGTAV